LRSSSHTSRRLFTPEQLESLAVLRDAAAALTKRGANATDRQLTRHATWALNVAWACGAASTRDPAAMPQLARLVLAPFDPDEREEFHPWSVLLRAAQALAGDEPALRSQLYSLADSPHTLIRLQLTLWLDGRFPAERELLARFATDEDPYVNEAARKRPGAVTAAWWRGPFLEDPLTGLSADEAQAFMPTFTAYVDAWKASRDPHGRLRKLWDTIGQMPERAAFSAARSMMNGTSWVTGEVIRELGAAVVHHPNGVAFFLETAAASAPERLVGAYIVEAIEAIAPSHPTLPHAAFTWARAWLHAHAEQVSVDDRRLEACVRICDHLWPADVDPRSWADMQLNLAARTDTLPYYLRSSRPLHVAAADAPWVRELFELHLQAPPDHPVHALETDLTAAAATWPTAEGLAIADRVLTQAQSDKAIRWALQRVEALAPARLADLWERPELRDALSPMLDDDADLLVRARRHLRAGGLTPFQAASVMFSLGGLRGETLRPGDLISGSAFLPADSPRKRWTRPAGELMPKQAATRDALNAHPDKQLSGPLTDADWDAYRAVRDADPDPTEGLTTYVFPVGPWHPADLAFFRRCVAEIRPGSDPDETTSTILASVAAFKPLAELVPLVEKLAAGSDADDVVQLALIHLRKQVSRPPSAPAPPPEDEEPW
jgi:hypothetical protein